MKGIIFKELIEMCEKTFGDEVVDKVIEKSRLDSGGSYTSVGNYDHGEILSLLTHLHNETKIPVKDLIISFTDYLMGTFKRVHPDFFAHKHVFDFFESIDSYIHVEVRKLYPDSNPPKISCTRESDKKINIVYQSEKPFADVAEGLILASLSHFSATAQLQTTDLAGEPGTHREFSVELS